MMLLTSQKTARRRFIRFSLCLPPRRTAVLVLGMVFAGLAAAQEASRDPSSLSPPSDPPAAGQTLDSSGWRATDRSPPLTPDLAALRESVRRTLAWYFHRPESSQVRSPWGVLHCIVGYGVDTPLRAGEQTVNAVAWLCANAPCNGMRLLYRSGNRPVVRMGPGYQGHEGQFLCILAQSRINRSYPLLVDGAQLSVADLIAAEQATCRSGRELTFKLIGLAHYLDSEASWQNDQGEAWDIPRLIREELAQPVVGGCCGGTHRLTGFSYAVRTRRQEGKPLDGQWARADSYLQDYHRYTLRLQNADGSFSTAWFERSASAGDLDRRLNTTGHILEWLAFSLPDDQLRDPQVVLAVKYLSDLMWTHRQLNWEIGPQGHALHALALYDERVFGGQPGKRSEQLAVELAAEAPEPAAGAARLSAADGQVPEPAGRRSGPRRRLR